VSVNGAPYGLYGVTESLDEQFLRHAFGSDAGNLYQGGYGADLKDAVADTFEVEEEGDSVPAYVDLHALAAAIDTSTDTSYDAVLDANFDHDALLRTLAVEIVIGNSDGYVSWANNFQLYDDVDGGDWWLLSLGPDQAFTMNDPIHDGWDGILATRCLLAPRCAAALDGEIRHVADAMERHDLLGFVQATRATIQDACNADTRKELPCTCMDSVVEYILERPDIVRAQLP
jgi:hypothetical protein